MPIFLSVALSIYGAMHLYALSEIWMAFPRSYGLGLALILAGILLTFSPLLVWFLERHSWHRATTVTAVALTSNRPLDNAERFDKKGLNRDAGYQRDAIPNRRDSGVHPLVRGVSIELSPS